MLKTQWIQQTTNLANVSHLQMQRLQSWIYYTIQSILREAEQEPGSRKASKDSVFAYTAVRLQLSFKIFSENLNSELD